MNRDLYLDESIDKLVDASFATLKRLRVIGIKTILEADKMTDEELLRFRYFGPVRLRDLREAIGWWKMHAKIASSIEEDAAFSLLYGI